MSEDNKVDPGASPDIVLRHYRGGHLIEQRHCGDGRAVAELFESLESRPADDGEVVLLEPQPPEAIAVLLREIADAIEQERPLELSRPLPHVQLRLTTTGAQRRRPGRGELKLLWQEQSHPGG